MTTAISDVLVLSLAPSARGFGFVLFESALSPCDWGVHETRGDGKNRRILAFAARMIDRYRPLVVCVRRTHLDLARRDVKDGCPRRNRWTR